MIIGGKEYREIIITDTTDGLVVLIDDEHVINDKVVKVELAPCEEETVYESQTVSAYE